VSPASFVLVLVLVLALVLALVIALVIVIVIDRREREQEYHFIEYKYERGCWINSTRDGRSGILYAVEHYFSGRAQLPLNGPP
jgi:hypothetical protein